MDISAAQKRFAALFAGALSLAQNRRKLRSYHTGSNVMLNKLSQADPNAGA